MQLRLLDDMAFVLQPPGTSRYRKAAGAARAGYEDMVRLAASLERVLVERKIEVGEWLFTRLKKPSENIQSWWAVGRISRFMAARTAWCHPTSQRTGSMPCSRSTGRGSSRPRFRRRAEIARMTGDRSRDLPDAVRAAVIDRLTAAGAAHAWIAMVREVVALDRSDEGRVFGEALPAGLKLIG